MDYDQITLMAQKITFSFEDHFLDKAKRNLFNSLFDRYLTSVDPSGVLDPYDAIIKLGRKYPQEFDQMISEMKAHALLID